MQDSYYLLYWQPTHFKKCTTLFAIAVKKLYNDMLVPMCIVPRGDDDGIEDCTWCEITAKKSQWHVCA